MNNNKKSFTLIEILVSISLFMIIIVFLYQALDMTQKSNNFFASKLEIKEKQNNIKKILFLDLIAKEKIINEKQIIKSRDENSLLSFITTNIYHNPFYTNVTYMLSRKGDLLRIESKQKFKSNDLSDDFFDTSYVDILDHNIKKFRVKVQKNKDLVVYLENNDGSKVLFNLEQK